MSGVSNSGTTTTFTITRNGGSDGEQTVYYRTVNGSAIGGTHFNHQQGYVTFADGVMSQTVKVTELGVTNAYNGKAGTKYSNADRTYSLEIYRVEGGGKIDETSRSKKRTLTKSSSYTIDRAIYTTEQSKVDQTEVSKTAGQKIQDTNSSPQGGKDNNVRFRTNRDNVENYHTVRSLSDYYTNSEQLAYLKATASGWYYRYELKAYEGDQGYEHAYMGTSEVPDEHFDLTNDNGKVADNGVVRGVSGQLWACNFELKANTETKFLFPSNKTGGKEKDYPTNISNTADSYNNKTWVKLGVDETCYAYFGASGKSEDSWYLDGLTSYVMVQDEKEPQLLGVAPMASSTYLPGDPITVALVFDEIVDSQNSSLSGLTITTNVGT